MGKRQQERYRQRHMKTNPSQERNLARFLVIPFVIVVALLVIVLSKDKVSEPVGPSTGAAQTIFGPDIQKIASQFNCPCGQCQDHVLSACECTHPNGGQEVKRLIQHLLHHEKQSVETVIKTIETKFGHRISL